MSQFFVCGVAFIVGNGRVFSWVVPQWCFSPHLQDFVQDSGSLWVILDVEEKTQVLVLLSLLHSWGGGGGGGGCIGLCWSNGISEDQSNDKRPVTFVPRVIERNAVSAYNTEGDLSLCMNVYIILLT